MWSKCVEWSWKEFDKIYDVLDVSFSKEFNDGRGLGESFFEDKMGVIVDELREKKLLKKGKEGAKLVFFKNDKYPPAMILKKDGATLYHTRDLATDKYRLDNFGKQILIINEVGSEQNLYFKQLFEMEKMLGWIKDDQRVHVGHGLLRFKDRKMSTRKGNTIWLEDVLGEAKKRAYRLAAKSGLARAEWGQADELILRKTKVDQELVSGQRDKDVEAVAIGALKWNDLKRDSKTNIVFDWDELLNMQGNSGPYIQYTFARTQSVLRKALNNKHEALNKSQITNNNDKKVSKLGNLDLDIVSNFGFRISDLNEEETSLLRSFIKFSEVIETAAERYAPNLICNYLFDLAQKFNVFYARHKILGNEGTRDSAVNFRLVLTSATGQILKNGLELLGIKAPERM